MFFAINHTYVQKCMQVLFKNYFIHDYNNNLIFILRKIHANMIKCASAISILLHVWQVIGYFHVTSCLTESCVFWTFRCEDTLWCLLKGACISLACISGHIWLITIQSRLISKKWKNICHSHFNLCPMVAQYSHKKITWNITKHQEILADFNNNPKK